VGGIPEGNPDALGAIVQCAIDMSAAVKEFGLQLRIDIHTGSAIAGVIGKKKFIYDLWGDAVNTASRMESYGEPGRIQVTQEVYEQMMQKFDFEARGQIEVKGKGLMTSYFVR
jgi:adenylate cyclase